MSFRVKVLGVTQLWVLHEQQNLFSAVMEPMQAAELA